jgi:hypothetical protein
MMLNFFQKNIDKKGGKGGKGGKYAIKKNARILICIKCASSLYCECDSFNLCTTYEHWCRVQKKYKYKIMGKYRLIRYLKKFNKKLKKKENFDTFL